MAGINSFLQYARIIDPRVDINNTRNKTYGIFSGGQNQTWQTITSTTFNDSQISWTANPPSSQTYLNRKVYTEVSFQLTFTGQSAGPGIPLLQASGLPHSIGVNPGTFQYDAPRCCPLAEAQNTIQAQINNDSVSTNLNTYVRIYQRFDRPFDEENTDLSLTPSMSDKSNNYDDLLGFNLNPLAAYGDNVVQDPRGGFINCVIIRNDSTGAPGDIAIVNLTVREPIWMSPFSFGRYQEEVALINVDQIQFNMTIGGRGNGPLAGLAGSLWSHAPAGSVLTSAVAHITAANLYLNFISPDVTQLIPQEIIYSYYEPTLYPTTTNVPLLPGATMDLQMNNVQLSATPLQMYVWSDERSQDFDMTKTNSYLQINKVNITYENKDGIMGNARPIDLYHGYLRGGGNMSWRQWNESGGILCVKFGMDIALEALNAPGRRGTQNLFLTLTVTNQTTRTIVPQLNVLVIQEGIMWFNGKSVMRSVGLLTQEEILASKQDTPISYKPSKNIFGSGFWDDVGDFFKRLVRPTIGAVQKYVPQAAPLTDIASNVASSYGLGLGRARGGALLSGNDLRQLM